MFRSIALAAAAVVALAGGVAHAQSTSSTTTRSTTTTTTDGTTTRTVTRSTTTGVTVGVDGEKVGEALGQALVDRLDPEQARIRRLAEPARTEDAYGRWRVTDGGRDSTDCRFELGEKAGFLGVRPNAATACPRRLEQLGKWRVQTGELVFYTNAGAELRRLKFVEGRFVGDGLEMTREQD